MLCCLRKKDFLIAVLLLLLLQGFSGFGQSREWFEAAHAESDPQKRLAAYLKAIENDANSMLAHYHVGVEYRNLHEYDQAEKYLRKAYALNLTSGDKTFKAQILYELALTYKALHKLNAAEDALRGARNLGHDAGFASDISLQLGEVLYQQGQFGQAVTELQKGLELESTAKDDGFYETLLLSAEQAAALQSLYEKADELLLEGKPTHALRLYEEINSKRPGFKDVESRIADLRESVDRSTVATTPDVFHDEPSVKASVERSRSKEKSDSSPKFLKERRSNLHSSANLDESERRKDEKTTKSVKRNQTTVGSPSKKEAKSPREKPTKMSVANNGPHTPPLKDRPKEPPQVETTRPSYERNLVVSVAKDRSQAQSGDEAAPKTLLVGGILLGILTVVAGLLLFSPPSRARMYIWTKNFDKAANLYEKMLARHPEKLWLYPILARVYDRIGRRDKRAMQVYEMMQHLNANDLDRFSAAIAYKYLRPPDLQSVKIEVVDDSEASWPT